MDKKKQLLNIPKLRQRLPPEVEEYLLSNSDATIRNTFGSALEEQLPNRPGDLTWREYILATLGRWDCPQCGKATRINTKCCKEIKFNWNELTDRGKETAKAVFYRARKIERVPIWYDNKKVNRFYNRKPRGSTVRHVVPLCGDLVSGLHTIDNLEYVDGASKD